jgi:hypothetical protein
MDALSIELARHIGQVMTLQDAKDIARAVIGEKSLDLESIAPGWHSSAYTLTPLWLDSAFSSLEAHRINGLAEIHPGEPVDVRWDRIRELERMGRYVIFAAVGADGGLAASLWLYFTPSLNNGTLTVTDDMLYVEPEVRSSLLAVGLCRYAEAVMFGLGARACSLQSFNVNKAGRLAKFLGYQKVADLYRKTNYSGEASLTPTRHQGSTNG